MHTCSDYRDMLWDFEYGLLESAAGLGLGQHLAACASCQDQLEVVRAGRLQLKQAALIQQPIDPFVPGDEVPATLPLSDRAATASFPMRHRTWLVPLAVAAAVLVAIGAPYASYRQGLARHELALDSVRSALVAAEARRDEGEREARAERLALVNSTRTGSLRLRVLGPSRLLPSGVNQFRILTTDLVGQARTAQVKVTLVDPARPDQVLFATAETECRGDWLVAIPSAIFKSDHSAARLQVVASTASGETRVQEVLPVAPASYLTQLTFSKPSYDLGDRVFFRTVTLDEQSLRPPTRPLAITCQLKDPNGQSKGFIEGLTLDGGIGGGEFALDRSWPEGLYTLTVSERGQRFRPLTHKFLVRRASALGKSIRLDRDYYRAGDSVGIVFRAQQLGGSPAVDLPVRLTLEVDGQTVGTRIESRTDAQGSARAQFKLPAAIKVGEARLTVGTGLDKAREVMVRSIPVLGSEANVEFYPEGGELVADVPNRMYFRALTAAGLPLSLSGQVVDAAGRPVAAVQTAGQDGLGVFTLTPRADESYQLRIESPAGLMAAPRLPRAVAAGIVLEVETPVIGADQPLRLRLHHAGEPRPVLVAGFARGQLVAQQLVVVKPGGTEAVLEPVPAAAGVLRLTVFDLLGGEPRPVAERLVYRAPATRLDLALGGLDRSRRPGEHVALDVQARTERGDTEPVWLLAAVVEAAAAGQTPEWGTHFLLRSQIHEPADLEHADLLVGIDPEARQALDRYLATHGWRRFTPTAVTPARAASLGEVLLLDNQGEIRRRYARALDEQERGAAARAAEHEAVVRARAEDAQRAFTALHDYRDQEIRSARTVLGAVCLALCVAGSVLLGLGLIRVFRQAARPRPYFAHSFAALLLSVAGVGYLMSAPEVSTPAWPGLARASQPKGPDLDLLPSPTALARQALPLDRATRFGRRDGDAASATEVALVTRLHGAVAGPMILRVQPVTEPEVLKPLLVRSYAHANGNAPDALAPDLLLWQPVLQGADGTARIQFDLPTRSATYRVWIHGHSPSGRLGSTQGTFVSQP